MIVLAQRFASRGLRLPVAYPDLQAQFHRSEEVAEVIVLLGEQPCEASGWGRPFNCIGQSTTHAAMRDICFEVFSAESTAASWWAPGFAGIAPVMYMHARVCASVFMYVHAVYMHIHM